MNKSIDKVIDACRLEVSPDGRVFAMVEVVQSGELCVHPKLKAALKEIASLRRPGEEILDGLRYAKVSDVHKGNKEGTNDDQIGGSYTRSSIVVFPKEIQDEFAIEQFRIPIRKILDWAAAEVPQYAETLKKIRREYYDGDVVEDYELELKEKIYETSSPTAEVLSIKRVARAADRLSRDVRKAAFEASMEDDNVRDQKWSLDQAEGRSTPFDRYMEDQSRDHAHIGEMVRQRNAASDAFVIELAHNKDSGFAAKGRARLATTQRLIDHEIEVRFKATDAAFKARKKELKAANSASKSRSST